MKWYIILSLVCVGAICATEKAMTVELFCDRDAKGVKLKWMINNCWEGKLKGFVIKKRMIRAGAEEAAWETNSIGPILPQLDPARNWSLIDSDASQHLTLTQETADYLELKKLSPVSNDDYVKTLSTYDNDQLGGIWLITYFQFRRGLILGFGAIDRNVTDKTVEYGIFPYYGSPIPSTEKPLDTVICIPDFESIANEIDLPVNFTSASRGMQLSWSCRAEWIKQYGIIGFKISRSQPDNTFETLTDLPVSGIQKEDQMYWKWVDRKQSPEKQATYRIDFVNGFDTSLSIKDVVYDPTSILEEQSRRWKEITTNPPEVKVEQVSDDVCEVSWTVDESVVQELNSWSIERAVLPAQEFKPYIAGLSIKENRYEDRLLPQTGASILYRVTFTGKNNKPIILQPILIILADNTKPGAPQNATAKWVAETDHPHILLEWKTADKNAGQALEGYRLEVDDFSPGKFRAINGVPTKENTYTFSPGTDLGRPYSFRITPVSQGGVDGLSAVVSTYAPLGKIPDVGLRRYTENDDGSITWTWKYPDNLMEDLAGFRIFRDGKLVADETVLDSEERSWSVSGFEENTQASFAIQAVSKYGVVSPVSKEKTYTRKKKEQE